jgi:hypothetical protein
MSSPDGKINMRLGDQTIPPYSTPNPLIHTRAQGPHAADYATGDVFATRYGQARFSQMCQSFHLIKAGPCRPGIINPDKAWSV